jgi:ATP-dependent RNA helicase RhlE
VPKQQKSQLLAKLLKATAVTRALVFTRTKHGADKLVKNLIEAGLRAAAIHGNKSQSARQQVLAQFKGQHPPILVATDIAARGLDIDAVSHVVNFDLPLTPEIYVHRIGRTARAGAEGIAVTLCDHEERSMLRQIERLTRQKLEVAGGDAGGPEHDDRAHHTHQPHSGGQQRPAQHNRFGAPRPQFGGGRKEGGYGKNRFRSRSKAR